MKPPICIGKEEEMEKLALSSQEKEILGGLLSAFKQGRLNDAQLKDLLIELGMMEVPGMIRTRKIDWRTLRKLQDHGIVVVIK